LNPPKFGGFFSKPEGFLFLMKNNYDMISCERELTHISYPISNFMTKIKLPILAWVLFVLNVLDTVLTDLAIKTGIGEEANPLAWSLYSAGESNLLFYVVKISLPLLVVWLAYRAKANTFTHTFMGAVLLSYIVISIFHVRWIVVYVQLLTGTYI
jgi:hypothetical protein